MRGISLKVTAVELRDLRLGPLEPGQDVRNHVPDGPSEGGRAGLSVRRDRVGFCGCSGAGVASVGRGVLEQCPEVMVADLAGGKDVALGGLGDKGLGLEPDGRKNGFGLL